MRAGLKMVIIPGLTALLLSGCANNGSLPHSQVAPPSVSTAIAEDERAQRLWQVFQRYQGTPYQYGGMSSRGFDCSGFINTAYREGLNHRLPRTTGQMLQQGQRISPDNIQPGDVVFFRINGKEQHAGIYMGNNQFIHASTSAGVTQSKLNGYYWSGRMTQARRFAAD